MVNEQIQNLYFNILKAVGGADNIATLGSCALRLRVTLKDTKLLNIEEIKKIPGVAGYATTAGQHQIIIGPEVEALRQHFQAKHNFAPISNNLCFPKEESTNAPQKKKKGLFSWLFKK